MLHLYSCTWALLLPSICCFKSACSSCSSDPTFPGSARICSPFGLVSHLGLSNHLYSFQALSEEGNQTSLKPALPAHSLVRIVHWLLEFVGTIWNYGTLLFCVVLWISCGLMDGVFPKQPLLLCIRCHKTRPCLLQMPLVKAHHRHNLKEFLPLTLELKTPCPIHPATLQKQDPPVPAPTLFPTNRRETETYQAPEIPGLIRCNN